MSKELSIIVPVYNVVNYLNECFDSLINQNVGSFEVIVVNDGSTDHSQDIIDQYVNEYPHIFKSYIKENGGLSDARNFGVPYAKGNYIAFLDSDDFVENMTYANMLTKAKETDADIVIGDISYFWEDTDKKVMSQGLSAIHAATIQRKAMLSPLFAWNKIFKKSFYIENEYLFPLNTWYEDIEVLLEAFSSTNHIEYAKEAKFHYRQHNRSIMANKDSERLFEIFKVMERVYAYFDESGKLEEFHNEIEYLFIEHIMLYGQFRFYRSSLYRSLCTHSFSFIKMYFPHWKKNIYLKEMSFKNKGFVYTNNELTMCLYRLYLK